ncbi:epsilon-sarcoglycan-like protein [Cricetulus griseus]|nr:epsilon-sarcoglycan-like protein [Cricetulus griseus]
MCRNEFLGYVCAAPPGSRYPRKPEKSVRFPGVVDNVLLKLFSVLTNVSPASIMLDQTFKAIFDSPLSVYPEV